MSATMAWQGGWVQLELSDMGLALILGKMANGGILLATLEETQYLLKKPPAEVQQEKMQGGELPGHKKVKAVIKCHTAMLRQNRTTGFLSWQHCSPQNP